MAHLFWIGGRYGLRHQLFQRDQILNIEGNGTGHISVTL